MVGRVPDQRVRVAAGRQQWKSVVFLHYRADAAALSRLLPPGLTPDLLAGEAWLSVTPLIMHRVRPTLLPPVPGWSNFPELNVRTYVSAPGGHDGLWFFTLDSPRRLMTWAGSPLDIPYRTRQAEHEAWPGGVRYRFTGWPRGTAVSPLRSAPRRRRRAGRTRQRGAEARVHELDVRCGDFIRAQSEQDVFLSGRWNAFTAPGGRLLRFPVEHQPWPLHTAEARGTMLDLVRDWELPVLDEQPIVQFSPGVDVRLALPRPCR